MPYAQLQKATLKVRIHRRVAEDAEKTKTRDFDPQIAQIVAD
jgi:hypothetical protein